MGTANTNPIFTGQPDIQWGLQDGNTGATGPLITSNTAMDGTGSVTTIFTADATNGGFINEVRVRAVGTNSSTSCLRLFVNNGSTNATIGNNTLIDEINLPITTASNSASQLPIVIPCNFALPAGFKLNVTIGVSGTGGWKVTAFGGKYTY